MCQKFFEFTLCKNDWKANSFLTSWYPNITRFRPKKGRRGKEVDEGNEDDVEMVEGTSKRMATGNQSDTHTTGDTSVPTKCPRTLDPSIMPRKRAKMADSAMAAWGMPMAMDPLCALR